MKFELIDAEKANIPVALACKALGVSRAGYYASKKRPESMRARDDRRLSVKVCESFKLGRTYYGSPRILYAASVGALLLPQRDRGGRGAGSPGVRSGLLPPDGRRVSNYGRALRRGRRTKAVSGVTAPERRGCSCGARRSLGDRGTFVVRRGCP